MKEFLCCLMLCVSFVANADSVNGSCLIGDSDYVEADFFYDMKIGNRGVSKGTITIANGSNTPLVSLNIEITAISNGKTITIYHAYKKFDTPVPKFSTCKIEGISYESVYPLSDINISIQNPRCSIVKND